MNIQFKSITKKMMAIFFLFLIALLLGIVLMNLLFFKQFKIWRNEKQMIEVGKSIENYFSDKQVTKKSVKKYESTMSRITDEYNFTIRIADEDYDILFNSRSNKKADKLGDQIVEAIEHNKINLETNPYCIINSILQESSYHIVYIKKLNHSHYLTISRTIKSINQDIHTSNTFLICTGSIVAMIGMFAIHLFSKSFTKPIVEINRAALKISKLDFETNIEVKSKDELGELAQSMNLISDRLSKSIHQLQKDVESRKQLVRDISHELKTPITAIKGYSEALKFGVAKSPEQMRQYYEIIVQECDRMNDLIYEMIELSKTETMVDAFTLEKIDCKAIFEEIREQYRFDIENKQIHYLIEIDTHEVIADSNLLKRGLKNLIENAIRHVNKGGTIRMGVTCEQNRYIFYIYNSGSHIAEDALASIWDVFYKTDESRRRDMKTFGIGLAIVKSVADLHHGEVEARNQDEGVEFRLILPKYETAFRMEKV